MTGSDDALRYKDLIERARAAAKHSYSPNSKYPVGAALLAEDGTVITACNVENRSMGSAVCAEKVAMVKAVSEGHRRFSAIAVVTHKPGGWPCGACRQFLSEFGDGMTVAIVEEDGKIKTALLDELLPRIADGVRNT